MIRFSRAWTPRAKLIVEYWADGPSSELPPGHWGLFAQFVSQRDSHTIDQDAKMFFAMHNASFDAGIVAWHIKRKVQRRATDHGGALLEAGTDDHRVGRPGAADRADPRREVVAVQSGNNLTPSFPGYFSGHSGVLAVERHRAGAVHGRRLLRLLDVLPANFGRVEPGVPLVPTALSYETFSDAADEAGLSRLYGGIHFPDDNTTAQQVGRLIGVQAWSRALDYFNGTASPAPR
jgi:hypothetical protein